MNIHHWMTTQNYSAASPSGRFFDRYPLPAPIRRSRVARRHSSSTNGIRRKTVRLLPHLSTFNKAKQRHDPQRSTTIFSTASPPADKTSRPLGALCRLFHDAELFPHRPRHRHQQSLYPHRTPQHGGVLSVLLPGGLFVIVLS